MSASQSQYTASDASGLRERNVPLRTSDSDAAKKVVLELNAQEDKASDEAGKKTYGRTPGGIVFTVPYTHDMVTQLLSPTEPKNLSDILVLATLALHILLLWLLPSHLKTPLFAAIFIFWRVGYNVGIGLLLKAQSNQQRLVRWATNYKLFVDPATGENPRPWLYRLLKRELETKIPKDYKFEEAPVEYNTWLVFRRVVDLILMCDFTSYSLFAIACSGKPQGEQLLTTSGRWLAGISLVLFNLWVKLDAHRVVKDFAWYWGDFFFLIDQELTFDGVFEMAPHPMYSVGYAGYYGISMMAASYKVLFISIAAHAAQFAFLVLVENPHIEKTYNIPPPRRQLADDAQHAVAGGIPNPTQPETPSSSTPNMVHNLLGFQNIDLYRVTDSSVLVLQLFIFMFTILTPSTPIYQAVFVANAVIWRLWYSMGIGYILNRQSERKKWTRHFVKFGEDIDEAWRQWKGTYHMSMVLCYASFIAAAWKMYHLPADWHHGLVLLKHVLGAGLVAVQIWVSVSIYDSLGEFGWFFGDFFFSESPKLTYSGIYRFLNNPERILGLAGVWGAALITGSRAVFSLALLSHIASLAFIEFVERPHMEKLYGRSLRQDGGVARTWKRSLPPPLRQWQGHMDRLFSDGFDMVDEFLDSARPKLTAGVQTIVKDTKDLFHKYPARITITRIEPDLAGLNPKDYSITISGTPSSPLAESQRRSHKEAASARTVERRGDFNTLMFEYGAPITVKWTAPTNHGKKDWIGLYMVADNPSRDVTKIASAGRWIATNPGEHDVAMSERGLMSSDIVIEKDGRTLFSGEMVFEGDKLWWTEGVFEFRYHHNGMHNVMAISRPFEVRIARLAEEDLDLDFNASRALSNESLVRQSIEEALLPVVRNCFDRDPEIAPSTVDEAFGALVERDGKYANRVVFAVHHMFGIEFAPAVVKADGCVRNLAWRICNAKKVLAPYSMSRSKGTSTPDNERD